MEVYLDLVMLLNFFVDFFLLLGVNKLSGFSASPSRCALAALLGSIYSGVCLLPGFRFLGNLLWRCISFGVMSVVAFGIDRSALKRGGVFLLLSMAMGGLALSLGKGELPTLVLAAVLIWLLCRVSFGRTALQQEYVPVTLHYGEKTVSIIALRDTGNTLRDPITGEPVLVVAGHIGEKLTGIPEAQFRTPLDTLARHPVPGLRLIPYRAVGQESGMLLGLRFEDTAIGGRKQSTIVAFAPEGIGRREQYQALTGGVL